MNSADQASSYADAVPVTAERSWFSALVRDLAPHDWLIFVYFLLLLLGVLFGAGPDRMLAGQIVVAHIVALVAGLALTRGSVLRRGSFASALVYRLTLFTTVLVSYLELRVILPASAPRVEDAALYAIDRGVFHYEPALAWERFQTFAATEWFSFFYFGYFVLLALFVLPFMFLGTNLRILARFATCIFFTFCCGHLLYIVVPGFGPYHFLASSFSHPIPGGFFWGLVQATVDGAGAQKDIFPGLHTAVPTMFTLLAFRYRKEFLPFRLAWPVVGFCASQILIATMYLRWHYLIDICAGVALAGIAVVVTEWAVAWDEKRRERLGLRPAWTRLRLGGDSPR